MTEKRCVVQVRVSEDERGLWIAVAKERGVSLSELVREWMGVSVRLVASENAYKPPASTASKDYRDVAAVSEPRLR